MLNTARTWPSLSTTSVGWPSRARNTLMRPSSRGGPGSWLRSGTSAYCRDQRTYATRAGSAPSALPLVHRKLGLDRFEAGDDVWQKALVKAVDTEIEPVPDARLVLRCTSHVEMATRLCGDG